MFTIIIRHLLSRIGPVLPKKLMTAITIPNTIMTVAALATFVCPWNLLLVVEKQLR